jgi:outer membrane lipoprotein LolB
MKKIIIPVLGLILALTGCQNLPQKTLDYSQTSIAQRNQQMIALNQWRITGKIAFLQKQNRQSASLSWFRKNDQEQSINLTTYLGINIFKLESNHGLHTLEVGGQQYQSQNLNQLIHQLTGLNLPAQALIFWLKGLAFTSQDKLFYDDATKLPTSLNSDFNHQQWQVTYGDYQPYQNYLLAHKITIKQSDLTIKININRWTI